ncbi:hypothetical protein EDC04DRAFT_2614254 [Pisolithus marmoratus]|nr:hypothetical protein EDC04DRAFT_2614254 [Pisolithus marmoratus]
MTSTEDVLPERAELEWCPAMSHDRYDNQGVVADLEEAVIRRRAAPGHRTPGHPDRGGSLYNLACGFKRRFQKHAGKCDLEGAIELHHAALELRPPGNPDQPSSLHSLSVFLMAADLEEAAALGHAALWLKLITAHPPKVEIHTMETFLPWNPFDHVYPHPMVPTDDILHKQAELVWCPSRFNGSDMASSSWR